MTTATTILIAEDQGMLLGALSALLDLEPDMQVVGKVSNGKEALAMAETGHFLRGDKLITLAADKGSPELPYLARRKYDGAAYSMTLDLDEAEGEQSGEETSDYPATLTIRDASEQVVYRKSGIAQCGA